MAALLPYLIFRRYVPVRNMNMLLLWKYSLFRSGLLYCCALVLLMGSWLRKQWEGTCWDILKMCARLLYRLVSANRVHVQAPTSVFLFASTPRPTLCCALPPLHGVVSGGRFPWRWSGRRVKLSFSVSLASRLKTIGAMSQLPNRSSRCNT